ncbi:hypothetical protein ACFLY2_00975 [Patescibacteria group bacterium]
MHKYFLYDKININKNLTKYKENKNKNKKMQNKDFDSIDILKELDLSNDEPKTINIENIISEETDNIFNIQEIKIQKEYQTIEYIHSVEKIENSGKDILKETNKFISSIIFLTKYILTSALIFAVLLVSTNYSAYVNIAKSYVFS